MQKEHVALARQMPQADHHVAQLVAQLMNRREEFALVPLQERRAVLALQLADGVAFGDLLIRFEGLRGQEYEDRLAKLRGRVVFELGIRPRGSGAFGGDRSENFADQADNRIAAGDLMPQEFIQPAIIRRKARTTSSHYGLDGLGYPMCYKGNYKKKQ